MWYKSPKIQKCALNSQLQALQILKNDDEFEHRSLSSFLLAVTDTNLRISQAGQYSSSQNHKAH